MNLRLLGAAAGASRLHAGEATEQIISEHRRWLAEAFSERADEAPGLVRFIDANGAVVATGSGWAMGPATAEGSAAWIEEYGEEYRYRVRCFGTKAADPLTPPDDFWAVAACAGHSTSADGAVVLWRPAQGTTPSDPGTRKDELWIAGIDRSAPRVVATSRLEFTLPEPRAASVAIGGTAAKPLLFMVGLPAPGLTGAYRLMALNLPALELAWETSLDVAADGAKRSETVYETDRAIPAAPSRPTITAEELRSMSSVRTTTLGDCSGLVVAHGTPLGDVLSTSLVFVGNNAGDLTPQPDIHPRDSADVVPVIGRPSFAVLGVAGSRSRADFVNVEEITVDGPHTRVLIDLDMKVNGKSLEQDPHLQPVAIAVRYDVVFGAPGVDSEMLQESNELTTPPTWHQPDRPRVKARRVWLKGRAKL